MRVRQLTLAAALSAAAIAATACGAATPAAPTVAGPLAGMVIGIDPGHNGLNGTAPATIGRLEWNGREWESCDTTGTETDAGFTESLYNWTIAVLLRARLRALGAVVVMTRDTNHGIGPCVNDRAEIIDRAHATVALDIHADGGPSWGRGFTVLYPVADGTNDRVIARSLLLAHVVRSAFHNLTGMPVSDYYGGAGLMPREDLAGLNLTTVPKILIECGNMRNPTDAAWLSAPSFQRRVAHALAYSILLYLVATHRVRA